MTSESNAVDPWSRFVSYCSLVVAVGALAWALFGFGSLPNWGESSTDKSLDSASIKARYDQEVQKRIQQDEEFRNQSKQQRAEQLTAFTQAADKLLREHEQLMNDLQAGGVCPGWCRSRRRCSGGRPNGTSAGASGSVRGT